MPGPRFWSATLILGATFGGCATKRGGAASPLASQRGPAVSPTRSGDGPGSDSLIVVTQHRIGPLPLDSTFGYLAAHFAVTVDTENIETTPFPFWNVRVGNVVASARQDDESPASGQRPGYWTFRGRGIILADSVLLPGTWGELRKHFQGKARLSFGELGPTVDICALPGLTFYLDFPYGDEADTMSVAAIPPNSSFDEIGIDPRAQPDSICSH